MPDESIGVADPPTQVSLSTGAREFELPSPEARRMPTSVARMAATIPEIPADRSGAIGEKVRRGPPDSDLVCRISRRIKDFRDVHGVSA